MRLNVRSALVHTVLVEILPVTAFSQTAGWVQAKRILLCIQEKTTDHQISRESGSGGAARSRNLVVGI